MSRTSSAQRRFIMLRQIRTAQVYTCTFLLLFMCSLFASAQPIIADHTACADFATVPDTMIAYITTHYNIYYAHTSHGSQIMTGIDMLYAEDSKYESPYFYERSDDLGTLGDTSWVPDVRTYLTSHPECNMAMFSWCGGCSDNDEAGTAVYLNKVTELETDYPGVTFIYMTGHLDGSGPTGNLYRTNNQIRAYCQANDKILFDFADIESYDPDGTYYPDETDACYWCADWCAVNDCPTCGDCAHSHCFNCYQKGKAWWTMMATISGWNIEPDTIPNIISVSPAQHEQNAPIDANIEVTFDIDVDPATIDATSFPVYSQMNGRLTGSISYDAGQRKAIFNPANDFTVGDIITVIVTDAIQTTAGAALEGGFSWTFTADVTAGSANFTSAAAADIVASPFDMLIADVNNDGNADIIATHNSGGINIMLGNGDFTFQASTLYTATPWISHLAASDFNGDGYIDIIGLGETGEYMGFTVVYLNDGDGTFTQGTAPAINFGWPRGICILDLNNDGYQDFLAAGGIGHTQIDAYTNNGDATFATDTTYDGGAWGGALNACDYNNDGFCDMAIADGDANHVTVFLNDGAGKFNLGIEYMTTDNVQDIYSADFDNDGNVDIMAGSESGEYMGYTSTIRNDGDGTFSGLQSYYMGYQSVTSVSCADLDNDSFIDVACAALGGAMEYMLNQGDGSFGAYQALPISGTPDKVACADADNDGDLDIFILNGATSYVMIYMNAPAVINCGDANGDNEGNVGDVVYIISYVFRGGDAPNPLCEGDANGDGDVNVADAVFLINWVFRGGFAPLETCCD